MFVQPAALYAAADGVVTFAIGAVVSIRYAAVAAAHWPLVTAVPHACAPITLTVLCTACTCIVPLVPTAALEATQLLFAAPVVAVATPPITRSAACEVAPVVACAAAELPVKVPEPSNGNDA